MTYLIALVSKGLGSWAKVQKLMAQAAWEGIVLFTYPYGKERFSSDIPHTLLSLDLDAEPSILVKQMQAGLAKHISGSLATEVALHFESGSGKEHMALLSAVLKSGLALRLVMPGEKEPQEL